MRELKELITFLLGFIPWFLFLFLSGHTLVSLERSIVACLLASLVFGSRELRKGFILQWGTLLFFVVCAVTVIFMHSMFVAENMGIISNGFLACLIWGSIFIGMPFTLQYARADLPKERWRDPALIRSCRFIAIIWALLLTFSALTAYFKVLNPALFPDWIYFDISIVVIVGGTVFTSLYKKYKRSQSRSKT
jgi:hypothetical protein